MKIVFFGTDENAKLVLQCLLFSHKVVLVVTVPDKIRSRGNKESPTPVKLFCIKNKISCVEQIPETKDLKDLNPDIIIVASYGRMIPSEIISFPKYGSLNLHPSLLPKYRGPSPVHAAIKNGDDTFGVSIIKLSKDIDAGPIVAQKEYAPSDDWQKNTPKTDRHLNIFRPDTKSLTTRLFLLGAEETLEILASPAIIDKAKEQDHSLATMTKKIEKKDGHINWNKPKQDIENLIRAFNDGNNSAYSYLDGQRIKILSLDLADAKYYLKDASRLPERKVGSIVYFHQWQKSDPLIVTTKNDYVVISKLQLEGKAKISGKEFINGTLRQKNNYSYKTPPTLS
tara:strand:+ start:4729 stop:5748 length:1020 start_codon:yes stop_codon:yes gene_type:complete